MQGIKNLIARRRPTLADGGHVAPPEASEVEVARPLTVEPSMAAEADAAVAFERTDFLADAIGARDHVPTPDVPVQSGYRVLSGRRVSSPASQENEAEPPSPTPVRGRKIWDVDPPAEAEEAPPEPKPEPAASSATLEFRRPQSSRAKTRLLGFHGTASGQDIFASDAGKEAARSENFPIGWLVLLDGPGRGASFTLNAGLSTVGRDPDQTVSLDFGDAAISRSQHVAIAFDSEENRTFIGHGGKQNIVRVNGKPLLTTEPLNDRDEIKIGKTTLRFVALCDGSFSWDAATEDADD